MEILIAVIIGGAIGFFIGRESGESRTFMWMKNTMNYFNYSDERREIIYELQSDMNQMERDYKEGKDRWREYQNKKK